MLDKGNVYRIEVLEISPEVNAQWIEYNPQHSEFKGDILVHHHKDRMSVATAIPWKVHQKYNHAYHYGSNVIQRIERYVALKHKAGKLLKALNYSPDIMDIYKIWTDHPESNFNTIYTDDTGFLNELKEGSLFFHQPSGTYLMIDDYYVDDDFSYVKYSAYDDYEKDPEGGWKGKGFLYQKEQGLDPRL